jgi:hypothetical protein
MTSKNMTLKLQQREAGGMTLIRVRGRRQRFK